MDSVELVAGYNQESSLWLRTFVWSFASSSNSGPGWEWHHDPAPDTTAAGQPAPSPPEPPPKPAQRGRGQEDQDQLLPDTDRQAGDGLRDEEISHLHGENWACQWSRQWLGIFHILDCLYLINYNQSLRRQNWCNFVDYKINIFELRGNKSWW